MYRTLIIDDDIEHARVIREMIEESPWGAELAIELLTEFESLESLLAQGEDVDILVTDIHFGEDKPTGIDFVRQQFPPGSRTQVIYLTGYVEYCTSVYQTDHVYFLTKPIAAADLNDAVEKALTRLNEQRSASLVVRSAGSMRCVQPRAISFIESDRRKVRIHVGADVLETYATLASLAADLPAAFVQCHKSFLVNLDYAVELRKNEIVLQSGVSVPVSQKRYGETKRLFFEHLQRGLQR